MPDFKRKAGSEGRELIPAIAQDAATGEVLMLAYMNEEAYRETLATGTAVYFSRSKQRLWRKGEKSGHTQKVVAIYFDCDDDTLLLKVEQQGAACHKGYRSCFFRQLVDEKLQVISERVFDPKETYRE